MDSRTAVIAANASALSAFLYFVVAPAGLGGIAYLPFFCAAAAAAGAYFTARWTSVRIMEAWFVSGFVVSILYLMAGDFAGSAPDLPAALAVAISFTGLLGVVGGIVALIASGIARAAFRIKAVDGASVDLGWMPALLIASLLIMSQVVDGRASVALLPYWSMPLVLAAAYLLSDRRLNLKIGSVGMNLGGGAFPAAFSLLVAAEAPLKLLLPALLLSSLLFIALFRREGRAISVPYSGTLFVAAVVFMTILVLASFGNFALTFWQVVALMTPVMVIGTFVGDTVRSARSRDDLGYFVVGNFGILDANWIVLAAFLMLYGVPFLA